MFRRLSGMAEAKPFQSLISAAAWLKPSPFKA
jgi:hypothetical protein